MRTSRNRNGPSFSGLLCALLLVVLPAGSASDEPQEAQRGSPLSPKDELATFRLSKGFHAELVACEPNVIDPVAVAFDEDGRLLVTEMPGYPNGGRATGPITSWKIKLLEDRDGDGFYEHCTTLVDGLRMPTCAMPWNGGVLVAVAPDITFFKDTRGTGRADYRRVLYTGFSLDNCEQLINGLQWGLDNWVYGCAASPGGTIRSPEKPDQPAVTLHNRGVRFHPERPGSLEPTSGGGQYGLAADDWERWFVNTNNQHLRHIILPDHYLRRNPFLAVNEVTLDIPDHGAACKVFRISPFEAWRVERTRRRREGADARRFPSTELVAGGYITSGCSPLVYTADLFAAPYRGNSFMCDPANNLIHRDLLVPSGATFVAQRGDSDHEFMASTDIWFRPVSLTIGPDGAIYVADFYREIIETPLSLPEDLKKNLNLESCNRGRIWRIVPDGFRPAKKPALSKATTEQLVEHLANANSWWRLTAQRLLVEHQDKSAIKPLEKLAQEGATPMGRAHALWTLHGLGALKDSVIEHALKDASDGVREQALRLAEGTLASSPRLRAAAVGLADDPSPRVRFQLAFTLGEAAGPEVVAALTKLARRDTANPWTQTAILSSCRHSASEFLKALASEENFSSAARSTQFQFLSRLAALVGAGASDAELAQALNLLTARGNEPQPWQVAILDGLGQGLLNSRRRLTVLWERPPPALREALTKTLPFFEQAARQVEDEKRSISERAAAARRLGYGPFPVASKALQDAVAPKNPTEVQLASIRALSLHDSPNVSEMLLAPWGSYSPTVRREVLEAVFSQAARIPQLLNAIEQKRVLIGQLEPMHIERLRRLPDAKLREQARKLFAGQIATDRQKVVDSYRSALDLSADKQRGKAVFKKNCSTCHRLENEGTEVGPDLLSALRTKTPETLLVDIFDPSREVDPRYINYMVSNKAGRVFTGMIAAETGSSLTLRRADKAEDTILRSQIDEIQATSKSLMPENLETQLSKQDVADLIVYLLSVAAPK